MPLCSCTDMRGPPPVALHGSARATSDSHDVVRESVHPRVMSDSRKLGAAIPIRIARIATVTMSSISVKPTLAAGTDRKGLVDFMAVGLSAPAEVISSGFR